ncbi:MAG: endonuclease/exonuclease/phosphatase family protein [Pseudomonadota bacterium]
MNVKPVLKTCVTWLSLLLIGIVLLGLTGQVFAPGNSAAVIRFPAGLLLVMLIPLLLWGRATYLATLACSAALAALVPLGLGYFKPNPPCEGPCLTLYQKNLMSKSWPREPLAEELVASRAEIVTLQEVSDHNRKFMPQLFEAYSFSITCPFRPHQEVALLTSLPVVENTEFCLDGAGMAAVQVVLANQTPLWVVSIHLEWPFPYDQFKQASLVEDKLQSMQGPILIGGDFNMVTWGGSVIRLAKAARAEVLGPYRNTYLSGRPYLPLPIDNVLVPEGAEGHLERRPRLASDHMGLLARIKLP